MNNIGFISAVVTEGVAVFLTILAFFGAIGIIVLLYFGTRKERFRYIESRLINKDKTPKNFDQSVMRALHRLTSRTTFYLIQVDVAEIESLEITFGAMQVSAALDILRKRCGSVFPFLVDVCKYEKSIIRILVTASTATDEMHNFLENLLIEARKPIVLAGALKIEVDVNVSVVHCPTAGKTPDELNENLDLALVVSKRKGLNNVVFHTPELNNLETEQYKQYMEIRKAIANNEFTLYFQKIVDCAGFETFGFETLLRWNHREHGVLPPDTFLKMMELSGDINWVGLWAFEQICQRLFEWRRKRVRKYALSLNLSAKQLGNADLFADFAKVAKNYDVDPGQILFEISDFEIWNKLDVARMNIKNFRERGFKIVLDDFNVGDEMGMLVELIQPAMIKLSRDYTKKLATDEAAQTALKRLSEICAERKISIVGCGVENEATVERLVSDGARYAQGFFFSKPQPIEDLPL